MTNERTEVPPLTNDAVEQHRPFQQFLIEQRNGALHGELTDALQEVVAAVVEHKKAGSLTLTIKIKPVEKAAGEYYAITDEVKAKAPEGDRSAALWFATEDGQLSRSDPRQPQLPIREVTQPTAVREVGA